LVRGGAQGVHGYAAGTAQAVLDSAAPGEEAALHVRNARVRLMDMLQRASGDPED
jgi:hypothetical protein